MTPYQKAAQVWDERIGSARVQAHNWRLMALGSLALSLILAAILLWLGRTGTAVPYVVEIDPKGGARAVGPAAETYRPSDAQIAFHLARFVENVRSLSIDPVVVRQSWLKAYDFVTDRAAVTLNEHARENDPFARVGRETVAVEVTSVVRASKSSFQPRRRLPACRKASPRLLQAIGTTRPTVPRRPSSRAWRPRPERARCSSGCSLRLRRKRRSAPMHARIACHPRPQPQPMAA